MELTRIIKERRSVHVFENRPVPIEVVEQLLETAVWVPNHKMTQPWRFILVHGEGRKKIAEVGRTLNERRDKDPVKGKEMGQKGYDRLMAVPMFLIVLMKENSHPVVREEDYASTSCLIHNFSLLAWEQGIGMVWETYPLLHESGFREALGIEPGEKAVGSLHLGFPAKVPAAQTRKTAAGLLTVITQ